MAKALFVTGTGTDIGKTYVTALLVKKLEEAGYRTAYYKAAMSGNDRREDRSLIPGDALWVKEISGISQSLESMCPYVYETAVSPHLASRIEGHPVEMAVVKAGFEAVCRDHDYVFMEGSGGILCPINFDEEGIALEDIVKECDLASILIADAGLGTINSVVLTWEYMKQKGLPLKAIIFNNYVPGDLCMEDNRFMCEHMTGLPVIACVKQGDRDLDIDAETLRKLFE